MTTLSYQELKIVSDHLYGTEHPNEVHLTDQATPAEQRLHALLWGYMASLAPTMAPLPDNLRKQLLD